MSERARFAVLSVMQTGRVATVDLGGDADLLQIYELFCLKAALVNTLIETGLVDYVNVLIGGARGAHQRSAYRHDDALFGGSAIRLGRA